MELIAKKLVSRSLMLFLFLSLGYLALPVSLAAQNYPQAVILEQKAKEASRVLQQRQREAARGAQEQVKAQKRVAGFEMLLVKATAEHAKMEQWHKARSKELKTQAKGDVHKKRLECRLCF
jgi:DNA-binding protein H-NS